MLKRFDPFVPLILVMILVAWLFPEIGVKREWIDPSELANWGVSFVFFFYGLKLNRAKIREGLSNVRLHLVTQISTFVLFPLLVLPFMPSEPDTLWLGVFFVAALPSTVSSSVVMVSIARGNVAGAIFNASISSLLGVVLTPLIMSFYLSSDMGGAPLGDVVLKLVLQVIVPVGAGLLMNKWWGAWASEHRTMLKWFDQTVILAIVWTAFCEGFESGIFQSVSLNTLIWLMVGMTALFFAVYFIVGQICKWLKFSKADSTTAIFCGSKKSLVHGTVMSKVLVSDPKLIGILILPIMIYHAMQLVVVSGIAGRIGSKADSEMKKS